MVIDDMELLFTLVIYLFWMSEDRCVSAVYLSNLDEYGVNERAAREKEIKRRDKDIMFSDWTKSNFLPECNIYIELMTIASCMF